jgi:hypothetical protein
LIPKGDARAVRSDLKARGRIAGERVGRICALGRRLVRRPASTRDAVADPKRWPALRGEYQKPLDGRVMGADPFNKDLDPAAADEPNVGERAAVAIDQALGPPGRQHLCGADDDITFQASAREEAGGAVSRHQHLGARRAGAAADHRCQRRKNGVLVRRGCARQGRSNIVRHAEHGPVWQ